MMLINIFQMEAFIKNFIQPNNLKMQIMCMLMIKSKYKTIKTHLSTSSLHIEANAKHSVTPLTASSKTYRL